MYTITIDVPSSDKGAEIEVDRLGIFANGGTYEIPSDVVQVYEAINGRSPLDVFKDHPYVTVLSDEDKSTFDPDFRQMELNELPDEAIDEMLTNAELDTEGTREEKVARLIAHEGEDN